MKWIAPWTLWLVGVYLGSRALLVCITCGGKTIQFANFSTAFSDLDIQKTAIEQTKEKIAAKSLPNQKKRLLKLTQVFFHKKD